LLSAAATLLPASAGAPGAPTLANANGLGVFGDVASTTMAGLSDSVISGGAAGVYARSADAGAVVRVAVIRSTIEHTTQAALLSNASAGPASLAVSSSMIANNASGWRQQASGVIWSLGNNHFTDNGASTGVLTPTPTQ
jgi:hypothetical protein